MKVKREEVVELYLSGKTYIEIAKLLNINKTTVSYHCRFVSKQGSKVTEVIFNEIHRMYSEGIKLAKIAESLNISYSTVYLYVNGKKLIRNNRKDYLKTTNKRNRSKKAKCVEYKGGCCSICGYNKSMYSLDFHHINPLEKDFGIASSGKTFEDMKPELDKCILVCRNCHGEIHEKLGGNHYHKNKL